jgi:hypothetical protein
MRVLLLGIEREEGRATVVVVRDRIDSTSIQ